MEGIFLHRRNSLSVSLKCVDSTVFPILEDPFGRKVSVCEPLESSNPLEMGSVRPSFINVKYVACMNYSACRLEAIQESPHPHPAPATWCHAS